MFVSRFSPRIRRMKKKPQNAQEAHVCASLCVLWFLPHHPRNPRLQRRSMHAKRLTPILNVSNIQQSFAWFEKLGWQKAWDWGNPPTFGGVCSGECEIFLCENGQGGRGHGGLPSTFGVEDGETADK